MILNHVERRKMAQRRMFSKKITDTDSFLDMPLSTQALYFHLNMGADDEGFVDQVKKIQRSIGASNDDLKVLIGKGFLIPFESGVVVIRHWRIHNYIQTDRFQATIHLEEKAQLDYDKSKIASVKPLNQCIQNVSSLDTQVRLGEDRLDKDRLELDKVSYLNGSDDEKKSLAQIIKSSNIKINERHTQMLLDYIGLDNMTVDMIQYAIEKTEDAGSTSFNYLKAILENWKKEGFTSLEQVEEHDRKRQVKQSKNEHTGTYPIKNPVFSPYTDKLPWEEDEEE